MQITKFVLAIIIIMFSTLAFASNAPRVAFIVTDDKIESPYNLGIYSGLLELLKKGKVSNVTYTIPKSHDDSRAKAKELINNNYDVIVMYSVLMHDIGLQLAISNPKVKFFVIDGKYDFDTNDDLPSNLYSMSFDEFSGGFLVGAFAGMMTNEYYASIDGLNKEKRVGIIKGADLYTLNLIEAGFRRGVEYVCGDCEVMSNTINTFTNATKSYYSANNMYNNSVDIIFSVAGSAADGIIHSANKNNKFVIGLDVDMFEKSDSVLVSSIKDVSFAVEKSLDNVIKADIRSKAETREFRYSFKDGVMKLSSFHIYDSKIPQQVKNRLIKIMKDIDSGEIPTNN